MNLGGKGSGRPRGSDKPQSEVFFLYQRRVIFSQEHLFKE